MSLVAWELVPTDFVLMVLVPAVIRSIWVQQQRMAKMEAKLETLLQIVAGRGH